MPTAPPYRVAIVGAGPSGLFAAQALLAQDDLDVRVDVLDRLPTPYGLLRYGVAPDHTSIKSVADRLAAIFEDDRVAFYGLVDLGSNLTRDELVECYDAVIYAAGASEDRRLAIPGEDLLGSVSAREFVAWYSGHPDATFHHLGGVSTAVTFGAGNVAVDVARILLTPHEVLSSTDMPELVLAELADADIRDVWLVGRRGPQHASFTTPELRTLLNVEGVAVDIDPAVLAGIDEEGLDRRTRTNLAALRDAAARDVPRPRATLHIAFWRRPVELVADGEGEGTRVTAVVLERTEPAEGMAVAGTAETETLPAELVLRAIGYRGRALPGVPFDEASGTIPNDEGRVLADGAPLPGEYVVGWIKRGPIGVIGTNKADATQTVRHVLADLAARTPLVGAHLTDRLAARGVHASTFADWLNIDAAEQDLGYGRARDRTKIESWHALRDIVRSGREGGPLPQT